MYEYEIKNIHTGATEFIWGYSWKNAARRAMEDNPSWNEDDYKVVNTEYVD